MPLSQAPSPPPPSSPSPPGTLSPSGFSAASICQDVGTPAPGPANDAPPLLGNAAHSGGHFTPGLPAGRPPAGTLPVPLRAPALPVSPRLGQPWTQWEAPTERQVCSRPHGERMWWGHTPSPRRPRQRPGECALRPQWGALLGAVSPPGSAPGPGMGLSLCTPRMEPSGWPRQGKATKPGRPAPRGGEGQGRGLGRATPGARHGEGPHPTSVCTEYQEHRGTVTLGRACCRPGARKGSISSPLPGPFTLDLQRSQGRGRWPGWGPAARKGLP